VPATSWSWSWARLVGRETSYLYGVIFLEASLIELLSYFLALLPGKHELIVVMRHSCLGNLFTVKSS